MFFPAFDSSLAFACFLLTVAFGLCSLNSLSPALTGLESFRVALLFDCHGSMPVIKQTRLTVIY